MKKYIGEIGLFFTSIVWGTGFVGTKLSLEGGLTPLQLITIRFLIAAILTALGLFDICVTKLKSALIIPITGFSHSITSAALEYRTEGLVLGIGANIFKLAGSVILYGVVAVYIFGLLRILVIGG